MEKMFTLFWKDGTSEVIRGSTVRLAFCKKGYGAAKLAELSLHAEGDKRESYEFKESSWVKK